MVCYQCGSGTRHLLPEFARKLMGRDTSTAATPQTSALIESKRERCYSVTRLHLPENIQHGRREGETRQLRVTHPAHAAGLLLVGTEVSMTRAFDPTQSLGPNRCRDYEVMEDLAQFLLVDGGQEIIEP
jgi:hypothetical protein